MGEIKTDKIKTDKTGNFGRTFTNSFRVVVPVVQIRKDSDFAW